MFKCRIFSRPSLFSLLGSVASLLALSGTADARGAMPVVGFLQNNSSSVAVAARDGYLKALADAGFVDGQTMHLILHNAQGDLDALKASAAELVSHHPDLIGTISTPALQAAFNATRQIPIVFTEVADPIAAGAGESAQKHLPNVTGVAAYLPVDKGLKLVQDILPNVRTVGSLYDPVEAFTKGYLEMAKQTTAALGLKWVEIPVTTQEEIAPGVQALKAHGVEAIMVVPSNLLYDQFEAQVQAAVSLGMPLFSVDVTQAEHGAVAAVGLEGWQVGYEAGKVAARVLRGESPAAIPFLFPEKQTLVVNPQAAARVGVQIPDSVLQRADRVVGQ
jgi:putative tryptophan/tyrosine transport system substrate-binding protein